MSLHGASPEAWTHFADTLGLARDLLPVVSNPEAEISPHSMMKALGKTPSLYNGNGQAVGIPKWTALEGNPERIRAWSAEPDLGICVQCRVVRAIDIDVEDPTLSDAIVAAVKQVLGFDLPVRWREDSGKQLLAFRLEGDWPKRVIPVEGGMIEMLGDGQQFVAVGRHPKGEQYQWDTANWPNEIPELSLDRALELFEMLVDRFATAEPSVARAKRVGQHVDLKVNDEVASWLLENWEVHDVGPDEQIYIRCPFEAEHTGDTGPSSTAYFPAGTGGYAQGHFVCLHAHCAGRSDHDYKDATGYSIAQFDVLEPEADRPVAVADEVLAEDPPLPSLRASLNGKIEVSARNLTRAIAHPKLAGMHLAFDTFKSAMMCRIKHTDPWRRFRDKDMNDIQIAMENQNLHPIGKDLLRGCISAVSEEHAIDSAITWLNTLKWDGTARVDKFCHEIWGWADTPYATAVSRYVWSALAGRVLHPGVQVDMVPILIGLQGVGKTTVIKSMVPLKDMYVEVRFNDRDDDQSRKLRGKLVGELEELRGLNSRDLDDIKAFITRETEEWVPKFKEFSDSYGRRSVLFGTTNETDLLADPTGERRWLPGKCSKIDIEKLKRDRDQYWAEGAVLFAFEGVCWEDAERLAKAEHAKFKVPDRVWTPRIRKWLDEEDIQGLKPLDKGYITVDEVLAKLGITPDRANRAYEIRAEKVLLHLGFERHYDDDKDVVYRRG